MTFDRFLAVVKGIQNSGIIIAQRLDSPHTKEEIFLRKLTMCYLRLEHDEIIWIDALQNGEVFAMIARNCKPGDIIVVHQHSRGYCWVFKDSEDEIMQIVRRNPLYRVFDKSRQKVLWEGHYPPVEFPLRLIYNTEIKELDQLWPRGAKSFLWEFQMFDGYTWISEQDPRIQTLADSLVHNFEYGAIIRIDGKKQQIVVDTGNGIIPLLMRNQEVPINNGGTIIWLEVAFATLAERNPALAKRLPQIGNELVINRQGKDTTWAFLEYHNNAIVDVLQNPLYRLKLKNGIVLWVGHCPPKGSSLRFLAQHQIERDRLDTIDPKVFQDGDAHFEVFNGYYWHRDVDPRII